MYTYTHICIHVIHILLMIVYDIRLKARVQVSTFALPLLMILNMILIIIPIFTMGY